MFAQFPVKPLSPRSPSNSRFSPRSPSNSRFNTKSPKSPQFLKREHRGARIYEPRSPTVPPTARIQPDRPAPILSLPGLPPTELPKSVITPRRRTGFSFGEGWIQSGKTWLAQLRPPWIRPPEDPTTPAIPPVTPKTAKFINESRYYTPKDPKFPGEYGASLSDEASDYTRDPPPLYKKNAPEGGIIGWASVAAAFLIQFCTIGYLFTWNVFEEHYNHVVLTDQNPIAVRFIGSVQWFLALFLSLIAGKLADCGFFRYSVMAGSGLFASSLFLLSLVGEEQIGAIFACQSLGMGIGIGLVFVPTAILPLHYFKRQRGLAIGIVMSGGSFGGMIFPAVLRGLIPNRGMSGAIRVTACIALVFLLIANCFLFLKTPPKPEKPVYPVPRLDIAKYSKEMEYIFATGGAFLTMLVIYYPAMYLDLLGLERGVDQKSAFNSVVILSFTGIIGRVGLGFASDFVGPWNLLMPVSGFLSLMLLTTCAVQGIKSLVFVSMFYGIFSGAWLSLLITALSTLASRMSETGTRIGLVLSISSFGLLFSTLIQHGTLTPNHTWVIPSAISGILLIGVTALAYFSRTFLAAKKPGTRRRVKVIQGLQSFQLL